MKVPFIMEIYIILIQLKLAKKGVNVRSFSKEKMRINTVLTFLAEGTKLPPLLVFRGKFNGPKKKNTKKLQCKQSKYFSQMPRKCLV